MIKIETAHLGDEATDDQAHQMVELLRERGYECESVSGSGFGDATDVSDTDWSECLEIVANADPTV